LICAQISPVSNSKREHKLGLPASSRKKRVEREGGERNEKKKKKTVWKKREERSFLFRLDGKIVLGVYNSRGVLLDIFYQRLVSSSVLAVDGQAGNLSKLSHASPGFCGWMDGWMGWHGRRSQPFACGWRETLVTHVEWKQEGEEGNQAGV